MARYSRQRLFDIPGAVQRGQQMAQQNRMANMRLDTAEQDIERSNQINSILGQMGGAPPEQRNALANKLMGQGPEGANMAMQFQNQWGQQQADSMERKKEYAAVGYQRIAELPPEQRPGAWQAWVDQGAQMGFDMGKTPREYSDENLMKIGFLGGVAGPEQQGPNIGTYNPRDYTTDSFAKFQQTGDPSVLQRYESQRTVDVGGVPHVFDPSRGGYYPAQVAGGQGGGPGKVVTAEDVGQSKATIEDRTTRAKVSAKEAEGKVAEYFDQLSSIQGNISNYNQAISALDEGAGTGAIKGRLPSVRAASVKLDNIRNNLGLDIIGNTTFGALSESELNFALDTAIPTKLDGPELRDWLVRKRDAQQKVADYVDNAIQFLSVPGNSLADLRAVQKGRGGEPEQRPAQSAGDSNTVDWSDL